MCCVELSLILLLLSFITIYERMTAPSSRRTTPVDSSSVRRRRGRRRNNNDFHDGSSSRGYEGSFILACAVAMNEKQRLEGINIFTHILQRVMRHKALDRGETTRTRSSEDEKVSSEVRRRKR